MRIFLTGGMALPLHLAAQHSTAGPSAGRTHAGTRSSSARLPASRLDRRAAPRPPSRSGPERIAAPLIRI